MASHICIIPIEGFGGHFVGSTGKWVLLGWSGNMMGLFRVDDCGEKDVGFHGLL